MRDIVEAAETLRQVRKAQEHFLACWALDVLLDRAKPLQRLDRDVRTACADPLDDPHNKNWSLLYRGSVLDD